MSGTVENKALVSVIIPCFNAGKFLAACLDSVLAQTYPDFEIICVNDGSTDDTLNILNDYASRYPGKIQIISGPQRGAPSARNTGFKASVGGFIQFLDADDFILPDKFERQLASFTHETDIVVSDREQRSTDLQRVIRKFSFRPIVENTMEAAFTTIIITANPLYRRCVVDGLGGYTEKLAGAQDWEFHLRAVLAGYIFRYVPGTLMVSRMVEGSVSSDWKKISIIAAGIILEMSDRLCNHPGFTSACRIHACRILYDSALYTGNREKSDAFRNAIRQLDDKSFRFVSHPLKRKLMLLTGLGFFLRLERMLRRKSRF